MSGHDSTPPDATLFKVLIAAGGAVSVWFANRYRWRSKKDQSVTSLEYHALDVAVTERGKTIDGLWVMIADLRAIVKTLGDERDELVTENDALREEKNLTLFRMNEVRQIVIARDYRIRRLESQIKSLGATPVNGDVHDEGSRSSNEGGTLTS